MSNGFSRKYVFNNKGSFAVRQLDVGEADVRNELRVGLYDDADHCIGNVTLRVDPKGEPQFVMTTGGDGFCEKPVPLIVVAPVRPYSEAAMLWDPNAPGDGLCKLKAAGTTAPVAASDIEATRAQFEHQIFGAHFTSTIVRTGMGGPIEFMPDPEQSLTKAELCARGEDGHYTRNEVSAMWFGWCEAMEAKPVVNDPDQGERFEGGVVQLISPDACIDHGAKAPRPKG